MTLPSYLLSQWALNKGSSYLALFRFSWHSRFYISSWYAFGHLERDLPGSGWSEAPNIILRIGPSIPERFAFRAVRKFVGRGIRSHLPHLTRLRNKDRFDTRLRESERRSGPASFSYVSNALHPDLRLLHRKPIVFFPAIHVTNFFKFVLLGQRHFIESVFNLTHGVRARLNGVMHLLRRTLSHCFQSRFNGFVAPTVVHLSP